MNRIIISFLFLLTFFCGCHADEISFFETPTATLSNLKVISIADGDTFTVLLPDKRKMKIRIYGIDAPESKQAFGQVSKDALAEMIAKRNVNLWVYSQDHYGRYLCSVFCTIDGKYTDAGLTLIKKGLAWHYSYFDRRDKKITKRYSDAQKEAKSQNIGLWSDPHPVEPHIFRKSRK